MWYVQTISVILFGLPLAVALLIIVFVVIAPATPPSDGILVSENQNTYLEQRVEWREDDISHPCFVMKLYYSKLGGWFQFTEQVLLLTQTDFNTSDRVQFKKMAANDLAPIRIWIPNNVKGEGKGYFVFTPPAIYQQARLIKLTVQ